jgi:hypothetical protein
MTADPAVSMTYKHTPRKLNAVDVKETEMGRQRRSARGVQWVNHYSSAQSILVVGDGDFSFSLALAAVFGSGENLVATSLDSYGLIYSPCSLLIYLLAGNRSSVHLLVKQGFSNLLSW